MASAQKIAHADGYTLNGKNLKKNVLTERYFPCNFLRVMLRTWRLFVPLTCTIFSSLYNTLSFRSVSSPIKSPSQFDAKALPINRPHCVGALKSYGREEKIRSQIWAEKEWEWQERPDNDNSEFPSPAALHSHNASSCNPNPSTTHFFPFVPLSTNLLLFLSN